MKRKAFKELMRQTVGNVLINTELNAEALKENVDPAVLRGVAYGMAVAPVLMDEEPSSSTATSWPSSSRTARSARTSTPRTAPSPRSPSSTDAR